MNGLRARVDALRRKMVFELAILRLSRLVNEFCMQYNAASLDRRTLPTFHDLVRRVSSAGLWLPSITAVYRYLVRCRSRNEVPEPEDLLRVFLPWSRLYPPPRFA